MHDLQIIIALNNKAQKKFDDQVDKLMEVVKRAFQAGVIEQKHGEYKGYKEGFRKDIGRALND